MRILLLFSVVLFLSQHCMGQSWTAFKQKHVLDPTADPGYASWNRAQWNTWLQTRVGLSFNTPQRPFNSVIVQRPNTILSKFSRGNPRNNAGPDFVWSSQPLPIFVLQRVTYRQIDPYNVFNCRNLFVLAKLDASQRPMHFHKHYSSQANSGTLNYGLNLCTPIT